MVELPASPLPDEPAYWEEMARRIRDDAHGPLVAYANIRDDWYRVVSGHARWLVAVSAAAMLILWLVLPASDSAAGVRWLERSLSPDEIAGALVGGPEPPGIDALMAEFPPAPEDEESR